MPVDPIGPVELTTRRRTRPRFHSLWLLYHVSMPGIASQLTIAIPFCNSQAQISIDQLSAQVAERDSFWIKEIESQRSMTATSMAAQGSAGQCAATFEGSQVVVSSTLSLAGSITHDVSQILVIRNTPICDIQSAMTNRAC